ncbi:MAG: hypothetical protein RL150_464 [Candidatus Parcubacteria bacterium]|jgi:RNA polymerase sigma-70 factor (ECF subfamily)
MQYEQDKHIDTLYDTYVDDIFRFLYNRLGSRERAIDLTQDVFVKMWQTYLSKGVALEYPKALLFRIARNMLINSYERDKKHESLEDLSEEGFDVPDSTQDAAAQARAAELRRMLARLPEQDAEIITLRHLEGFSVQELAVLYDVSENVLSVRLHRALAKLEAAYKPPTAHD